MAYGSIKVDSIITSTKTLAFDNVAVKGEIVNADINASAAIALSKLATGALPSAITISSSNVATTLAYNKLALTGNIVDADISSSAAIADTKLATISTAGKVANSATTATNANTASAIVARDASGNFTAGTITASLSGNASTAAALQTARTIQGVSFDGTANINVVTAGAGITVTGTAVAIASTSNGFGTRTVSTGDPTGGTYGDIWLKV